MMNRRNLKKIDKTKVDALTFSNGGSDIKFVNNLEDTLIQMCRSIVKLSLLLVSLKLKRN